jgi:capsular exopolysaccharide synthesis family protein
VFKLSNTLGLSDYLIGEAQYEQTVQCTGVENLFLLPAGTRPPNPAELLTTDKMQTLIKEIGGEFDYVIIDTPPVLIFTDAQILSNYADGSILVIAAGETSREEIVKARELLKRIDVRILGVVLNKHDASKIYDKKHLYYYENTKRNKRRKRARTVQNMELKGPANN